MIWKNLPDITNGPEHKTHIFLIASLCLGLWQLLSPTKVASQNNNVELVGIVSPQLSIDSTSNVSAIQVQLQPELIRFAAKSAHQGSESRTTLKVMELTIQMNGEHSFDVVFEPIQDYLESLTGERIPFSLGISETEDQPTTFSTQEQSQVRIASQGQELRLNVYLQIETADLQTEQTYQSEIMLSTIDQ